MAMTMSRSVNPQDIWDILISLIVEPGSIGEALLMRVGDYVYLRDHFEAVAVGDYEIPYTVTVAGAGTLIEGVQDEPSQVRLNCTANLADIVTLESDITTSLLGQGRTTLMIEWRSRIDSEAQIAWQVGLYSALGTLDSVMITMDTGAAPPRPNGVLRTRVGGALNFVDLNLAALYNLTEYHTFRLEITPSGLVDAYVDEQLVGSQAVGANVPPDQSYMFRAQCNNVAAAAKYLDIDYFKVWST